MSPRVVIILAVVVTWCLLLPAAAHAQVRVPPKPQQAATPPPQQQSAIKLARVKYSGGGDWYNDPSAEINLLRYIRTHTTINVDPVYEFVDLSTDNVFLYPVLFMTGHGTVNFTESEVRNLRAYL